MYGYMIKILVLISVGFPKTIRRSGNINLKFFGVLKDFIRQFKVI